VTYILVMRLEARLRAFAAFARRHSFSGAAQDLRISQPAVSKHIADVERQLGVPLVDADGGEVRSRRPECFSPTMCCEQKPSWRKQRLASLSFARRGPAC
jgi:hypothetical protein